MDKPDKPYGEIRFDVILDHLNKYKSFTEKDEKEIRDGIQDIMDTVITATNNIKNLIRDYFSDELQNDETPMGAMKRNQIRKELLDFAHR
jgi:hypothetical protein